MTCFIKTRTIKAYLCGISFFSKFLTGNKDLISCHPQITPLLRGLKQLEPAPNPRCLPLTADMSHVNLDQHHPIRIQHSSCKLSCRSHILTCFLGFLRCSEFTASTLHFYPHLHACVSDLSYFSDDTIVLYLKQTKTNQPGLPTAVLYFKHQSSLSPKPLANYLQHQKTKREHKTNRSPLYLQVQKSGYLILIS